MPVHYSSGGYLVFTMSCCRSRCALQGGQVHYITHTAAEASNDREQYILTHSSFLVSAKNQISRGLAIKLPSLFGPPSIPLDT